MRLFRRRKPAPAPVDGAPPIPPIKNDPFELASKVKNLHEFLERQSIMPIFIAMLIAVMIRSSFTYALGTWNPKDIPPIVLWLVNFGMGFFIAGAMELIGTIAGRKWIVGWRKYLDIAEKAAEATAMAGIKIWRPVKDIRGHLVKDEQGNVIREQVDDVKALKAANQVKKSQERQKLDNRINLGFGMFGNVASVYAAVNYALNATGNTSRGLDIGKLSQDLIVSVIIVTVVFYIGVLYEPEAINVDELATTGRKRMRYQTMIQAYERISTNTYTNEDLRYLIRSANPDERAELEGMIHIDRKQEIWNTAQVANWLGDDGTNKRREITRRIAKAFKDGIEGVAHNPDRPKEWIITLPAVVELFGKEFMANSRTGNGHDTRGTIGGAYNADSADGQGSDKHRRSTSKAEGAPEEGRVIDSTLTDPEVSLQDRMRILQEQIEFIERAALVEIERDPQQDITQLADRLQIPVKHIEAIRNEYLRSLHALPAAKATA